MGTATTIIFACLLWMDILSFILPSLSRRNKSQVGIIFSSFQSLHCIKLWSRGCWRSMHVFLQLYMSRWWTYWKHIMFSSFWYLRLLCLCLLNHWYSKLICKVFEFFTYFMPPRSCPTISNIGRRICLFFALKPTIEISSWSRSLPTVFLIQSILSRSLCWALWNTCISWSSDPIPLARHPSSLCGSIAL